ncbi:unnamed protein product [Pleuronectes platessa]|uniref:Uncharacterized protein n=1 Tax=Pleuronectes platessa TaxID=8262 RepID=A0A9N7VL98_PLEPL|nr:unnamed protein product [Pleuronectes platessa]
MGTFVEECGGEQLCQSSSDTANQVLRSLAALSWRGITDPPIGRDKASWSEFISDMAYEIFSPTVLHTDRGNSEDRSVIGVNMHMRAHIFNLYPFTILTISHYAPPMEADFFNLEGPLLMESGICVGQGDLNAGWYPSWGLRGTLGLVEWAKGRFPPFTLELCPAMLNPPAFISPPGHHLVFPSNGVQSVAFIVSGPSIQGVSLWGSPRGSRGRSRMGDGRFSSFTLDLCPAMLNPTALPRLPGPSSPLPSVQQSNGVGNIRVTVANTGLMGIK